MDYFVLHRPLLLPEPLHRWSFIYLSAVNSRTGWEYVGIVFWILLKAEVLLLPPLCAFVFMEMFIFSAC